MDIFNLICHAAFDQPPLTGSERVNNVKKRDFFTKCGDQARKVLEALLEKYADEGIENIENMKILQVTHSVNSAPRMKLSNFSVAKSKI